MNKRVGRQARGLNPLHLDHARLFLAVLRGEHLIKGFRNKDIVRLLYPSGGTSAVSVSRSRKVTRLFRLLWVHGLIGKIPRSRSWKVTGTVVLRHQDIPERVAM